MFPAMFLERRPMAINSITVKKIKSSVREPMPTPGKNNILPLVINDLQERDKMGTVKYGTTLQSHNGRDSLMDAYQEALDLVMYLRQLITERETG